MVVTVDMSGKQSIVGGVILGSLVECKQNSKIGSIVSIAAAAAAAAACVDDDADSRGRRRCFEQKTVAYHLFLFLLWGGTRGIRVPALRPASRAVRNPKVINKFMKLRKHG